MESTLKRRVLLSFVPSFPSISSRFPLFSLKFPFFLLFYKFPSSRRYCYGSCCTVLTPSLVIGLVWWPSTWKMLVSRAIRASFFFYCIPCIEYRGITSNNRLPFKCPRALFCTVREPRAIYWSFPLLAFPVFFLAYPFYPIFPPPRCTNI